MTLQFAWVDVFTERPFGGNPLAVVVNADGLDSEQMQRVAMEFGLQETTFVLPASRSANTARVRIFTPRSELPFAGHPNIGTAFVLASRGEVYGREVSEPLVFEEAAGEVRIELERRQDRLSGARLAAPQPFSRGDDVDPEIVASACSLDSADLETAGHLPCVVSCGLPFVAAELKSRAGLAAASPRSELFASHLPPEQAVGILLYVGCENDEADIRARMFAPLQGPPEDPATGSANVALVSLLAALDPERDVSLERTILQGVEMGRPSRLEARAEKRDGVVTESLIGGSCVRMMEGSLSFSS